ncbi:MAG: DNA polymerase beta superfamily protein [Syntrophothermus sp.]
MRRRAGAEDLMVNEFWRTNLILKVCKGSTAYGINIDEDLAKTTGLPVSDTDYMGICVPPKEYVIGLKDREFEQYTSKDPDETVYALKKYMRLALNSNPSIIETLFMPQQFIVYVTAVGRKLIEYRHLFLSKRIKEAFKHYASAQQKQLVNKRRNAANRVYLVEKYGFDTKYAMHLVRLLRTGIEVLKDGEFYFPRPDAQELLDIRTGKYTLAEVNEMAEDLKTQLEDAYFRSKLPEEPDFDRASKLCVELHEEFWEGGKQGSK